MPKKASKKSSGDAATAGAGDGAALPEGGGEEFPELDYRPERWNPVCKFSSGFVVFREKHLQTHHSES